MADGALSDLHDVLLAAVVRQLIGRWGLAPLSVAARRRGHAGPVVAVVVVGGGGGGGGGGSWLGLAVGGSAIGTTLGRVVTPVVELGRMPTGQMVLDGLRHRPLARRLLQLVLQADDDLIRREVDAVGVLAGSEAVEEAVDGRVLEGRAEGVQHRRQLDLADAAALVGVVLLQQGAPELLTQGRVRHVLGSDVELRAVLGLPAFLVLQRDGQDVLPELRVAFGVGAVGAFGGLRTRRRRTVVGRTGRCRGLIGRGHGLIQQGRGRLSGPQGRLRAQPVEARRRRRARTGEPEARAAGVLARRVRIRRLPHAVQARVRVGLGRGRDDVLQRHVGRPDKVVARQLVPVDDGEGDGVGLLVREHLEDHALVEDRVQVVTDDAGAIGLLAEGGDDEGVHVEGGAGHVALGRKVGDAADLEEDDADDVGATDELVGPCLLLLVPLPPPAQPRQAQASLLLLDALAFAGVVRLVGRRLGAFILDVDVDVVVVVVVVVFFVVADVIGLLGRAQTALVLVVGAGGYARAKLGEDLIGIGARVRGVDQVEAQLDLARDVRGLAVRLQRVPPGLELGQPTDPPGRPDFSAETGGPWPTSWATFPSTKTSSRATSNSPR